MADFKNINDGIKFGTDGWRAVIADSFTFENVQKVAEAIAKYLQAEQKNKSLIVGYDTRFLSFDFAKFMASVLQAKGIQTFLSSEFIPTPVLAYHATKFDVELGGAIQFTASHNPPKYCGVKFITNYGSPAQEEITNSIMANLGDLSNQDSYKLLDVDIFNPKEKYFTHIKSLVDFQKIKQSNLKVVFDPLFGAAQGYLDELLKRSGCECFTIHNIRDPLFGGMLPEPKEEFLHELKAEVITNGAVVGFATDGDGDRLGVVDEKGIYYSPNKIASMLYMHLLKNKKMKGSVARTLSTTHLLDKLSEKYNFQTYETKVGFKWIANEFMSKDILLGAEESGGISIKGHVPDKDAILSAMLVVEMLAYENNTLSQIYSDVEKFADYICINDRFDLHIAEKEKLSLLKNLESKCITEVNKVHVKELRTLEGVKYIFEDGSWFYARPSGTEPMARVYFESTDKTMMESMKKKVSELIASV